jgi:hypothetical protein
MECERAPGLAELLCHERRTTCVLRVDERVPAPGIESHRARIDVGLRSCAAIGPRETLGQLEKPTAVAPVLQVGTNRDTTKGRHASAYIDANDADGNIADPEHQRMVSWLMLVWMIRVVRCTVPAQLEQHVPTNFVIDGPVVVGNRRSQFFDHARGRQLARLHMSHALIGKSAA